MGCCRSAARSPAAAICKISWLRWTGRRESTYLLKSLPREAQGQPPSPCHGRRISTTMGAEAQGMYRSISTQAIVIRRERLGEFHKSLTLLTSDLGLISAAAYGAYKMHSHLRVGSEPFTWSTTVLYHNPVKKSYKVTDLDIQESFPGLQSDLSRLAAASLWAEVVQKSFGAGEMTGVLFKLFLDCLRLLDAPDLVREPYVTIQFLWRFLSLAGYQPETRACERCGAALGDTQPAYYSP